MKHYGVVIVGAGPAGIAAAKAVSQSGKSVIVIDDNGSPGGQIWRGSPIQVAAEFVGGARVVDGSAAEKTLLVETSTIFRVGYSKLILATGARELFLPFPGWTRPNIFGVGGLQALAKSGLSVKGKRIVVAGSGPLLLAVAAYLSEHGATVPLVAEQASYKQLARFGLDLLQHPSKIKQALAIRRQLGRTRYLPNCWVTEADGTGVTLAHNGKRIREEYDYLAVGYGFVPNTELPRLLGCELEGDFVAVGNDQQSSVPDVYCAGEITGLGGVDKSSLEGEIAGLAATGQNFQRDRTRTTHFSRALKQTFALRSELSRPPNGETIICRCEDVPFSRIENIASWSEAKLHFRCGMGPCQGRVCGPIIQHYFGIRAESVRPPIFPTKLSNLMTIEETIHR